MLFSPEALERRLRLAATCRSRGYTDTASKSGGLQWRHEDRPLSWQPSSWSKGLGGSLCRELGP